MKLLLALFVLVIPGLARAELCQYTGKIELLSYAGPFFNYAAEIKHEEKIQGVDFYINLNLENLEPRILRLLETAYLTDSTISVQIERDVESFEMCFLPDGITDGENSSSHWILVGEAGRKDTITSLRVYR